jgi:quercetin dioxygenase-like cupin family protein
MTTENKIYSGSKEILKCKIASCDIYYMKSHTREEKHYHNGIEIVFVLNGNCSTHKKWKFYFYRKGEIHEVANDSPTELALLCLTIPPETDKNTFLV